MSEMNRVYLFHIDYDEDIKNILRYGIPLEITIPPMGHMFYMFDKDLREKAPSNDYYELNLGG